MFVLGPCCGFNETAKPTNLIDDCLIPYADDFCLNWTF